LHLTGGKALPTEVIEQIVAKADGVPLFVEELVKTLLEAELLRQEDTHYVLTRVLPPLAIPATLEDSLMARLDRLGRAREVAQLGAVLGREFAYEVRQAVSPVDAPTLQHELRRLVDAELLHQRGLPPRSRYRFQHALIQDAAYQSLLKRTRQQMHQQIVQVLQTRFAEAVETQPELLAHHCTAAGLYTPAVEYWRQAGQRATARSAYREAAASFEQALAALQHLPESPDTMRQQIDLHCDVRVALQPLNAFAQILPPLREAERLAEALSDPQRLARCLAYLGDYFNRTFQYTQAIEVSQRALTLASAHGDSTLQLDAQYRIEHRFLGSAAPLAVVSRWFLTLSLATGGAFAEGLTRAAEAARLAEAVDHPWSRMFAAMALGWQSLTKGDFTPAIAAFERFLALGQHANIPSIPENSGALVHHPIKEGWKLRRPVRHRQVSTPYLRYAVLRTGVCAVRTPYPGSVNAGTSHGATSSRDRH
jgi:tetratricopeptide (TPR) repeat protein